MTAQADTGEPADRIVVVTGGASGIGAAIATILAEKGYRAVAVDLRPRRDVYPGGGILHWSEPLDVADPIAVTRGVEAIEEQVGPIHGLVNAAGVLGKMHPPERLRPDTWDFEMAVDLKGTFLMCREVGARMVRRQGGAIVNIASIAGMSSGPIHAYSAAKAGVIRLTMTLAGEWGRSGVRVNAVSPGFTATPGLEAGIASGALDEARLTGSSALGRLLRPEEIGEAAAWLISPSSSGVTGVNLPVDAGFLVGATWDAYGGFRNV